MRWPVDFVNQVICGDALETLRQMPDCSVNCCITSPPYWGLRDYGVDGQLGLETTLEEYTAKMVEVFAEVRRVLRDDGTLWLNLGDCYANGGTTGGIPRDSGTLVRRSNTPIAGRTHRCIPEGLKKKDLIGVPWRVAFALQAAHWYLRSDIIWSKRNPMPESVSDRPTRSHEYIFLFAKSEKYYYDHEAIREPASSLTSKMPDGWDTALGSHGTIHRQGREKGKPAVSRRKIDKQRGHGRRHAGFNDRWDRMTKAEQQINGANKRSVWEISTQAFAEAHFATFPEKLIEPCILAGCPKGGIILDPFFGSGTVGKRAKELGRRWIGIDLNPEYCELAKQRVAQKEIF